MSEKLTKGRIERLYGSYDLDIYMEMPDDLWLLIEADREAVREETRAEILKDHFRLDEVVLFKVNDHDASGKVGIIGENRHVRNVRRPPKMRAKTREEKKTGITDKMGRSYAWIEKISDEFMDEIATYYGIPTEVEEP